MGPLSFFLWVAKAATDGSIQGSTKTALYHLRTALPVFLKAQEEKTPCHDLFCILPLTAIVKVVTNVF